MKQCLSLPTGPVVNPPSEKYFDEKEISSLPLSFVVCTTVYANQSHSEPAFTLYDHYDDILITL